ncbi:hypothetical protein [Breoghania sp.]|uniref:hypothetical protein n=1 Tax=Breoghania sp. TaxID=2065378 RepID=UPI00262ACC6A|nr:hypothetical protein [Breoghania sp.]MDJ0929798.1 hypothetical protein [Breoghania sp.]
MKPFVGPVRLAGAGRLKAGNAFDLQKLSVETAATKATLAGIYAPQEAKIAGDVSLPDLSTLSDLAGRRIGGTLAAHITFDGAPTTQSGTLTFNAKAQGLDAGEDPVTALLGGEATLSGTLSRTADGEVDISETVLESPGIKARVSGHSDLETVSAQATATVSDLKPLDDRLAGALTSVPV